MPASVTTVQGPALLASGLLVPGLLVLALVLVLGGCGDKQQIGDAPVAYDYAGAAPAAAHCGALDRVVAGGTAEALELVPGTRVIVRTPANYRADVAHPLLVVFAAATHDPDDSERFTGLTAAATGRGFVVAYVGSRRLSRRSIARLTQVPKAVMARWCIDRERLFAIGHSDGGTLSIASVLVEDSAFRPTAIVASAAGFRGEDLATMGCPTALPVQLYQLRDDRLFPGYVRELADWLAACDQCDAGIERRGDGCRVYRGCNTDAPVEFCEIEGPHTRWPARNARMLEFLLSASSPANTSS